MLTSCLREHGKSTSLLETWYLKDRNAIPSFYVLQPISSIIPGYKDRVGQSISTLLKLAHAIYRDFFQVKK